MKNYRKVILSGTLLLIVSNLSYSAVTEDISKIGMGARPVAMGRAFLSIADDINSIYTNPAGLSNLKSIEITSMYTSLFEGDLNYVLLGIAKPYKFGTLGFGFISTGTGQILSTSTTGATTFDYYDRLFILSYARKQPFVFFQNNVYIGLNFKYFQKGFSGAVTNNGRGINADLSFLINPQSDLKYALTIQNFLPTQIVYDSGGYDDIISYIKPSISKSFMNNNLLMALDIDLPIKRNNLIPITFHFGGEYKLNKSLFVRLGVDQNISASSQTNSFLTGGIGLNLQKFVLDYAYRTNYESIALTHFISLSYKGDN